MLLSKCSRTAVVICINWRSSKNAFCECAWYVGCWSACVFWYTQHVAGVFVCLQHTRRMTSRMRSPKRAVSPNRLSISLRTRTNLSLELWTVETAPGEDCFSVCVHINPSAFPPSACVGVRVSICRWCQCCLSVSSWIIAHPGKSSLQGLSSSAFLLFFFPSPLPAPSFPGSVRRPAGRKSRRPCCLM